MKQTNEVTKYDVPTLTIIVVVYVLSIVGVMLDLIPSMFLYGMFVGQIIVYILDWVTNWEIKKEKGETK